MKSNVLYRSDGIEILPVGIQSWFAAAFVVLWFGLVLKWMVVEPFLHGSPIPVLPLLIFGGAGLFFFYATVLRGFLHEWVIMEGSQMILASKWVFVTDRREYDRMGINDLCWNKGRGKRVSFRDEKGKRHSFGVLLSLDDAQKVCLHLEGLLPQGSQLTEKTAAKRRKLDEENKELEEVFGKFGGKDDSLEKDLDLEQKKPLLGGLSGTAWMRVGFFLGMALSLAEDRLKLHGSLLKTAMNAAMIPIGVAVTVFCARLIWELYARSKGKVGGQPGKTKLWQKFFSVIVSISIGLIGGILLGGVLVSILFGHR